MQHGEHYKFVAREQHVPVPAPDRFFRRTLFPRARLTVLGADGTMLIRCLAIVFAVAGVVCWLWPGAITGLLFPALTVSVRESVNRRTILRWSRHSLVYPTIERQNALSIPLIAIRVRQLVVVAA